MAARTVAARAAKADGDAEGAKALTALRRPSVAAWLVNILVVGQPAVLEQLLDLGPALAQAQAAGRGEVLRELGAQRRALVGAVTDQAVALADRPVTTAVRDEVAGTLEAALSDPASADAVRSGRLVRALSYAGFGGVDLTGAVAAPAGRAHPAPTGGATDGAGTGRAEAAAHAAAGQLDDAVRACEARATTAASAEQAAEQARQLRDEARAALEQAERALAHAEQQAVSAQQQAIAAVAEVQRAQQREEQARQALDRLRRGSAADQRLDQLDG